MNISLPMISVIVPVYNVESYLSECLDALLGQTFSDLEIICVDDGSTDGSSAILADYARKDSRIRIITQKNKGLACARNTGLDAAAAEYIMFCDSDDFYSPDCCENAFRAITASPEIDLAVWSYRELSADPAGMILSREYREPSGVFPLPEALYQYRSATAWNKIYRKAIIDRYHLRFPAGLIWEDLAFFYCYIVCCRKVSYLAGVCYNYRIGRSESIMWSVKHRPALRLDGCRLLEQIVKFYYENSFLDCRWSYLLRISSSIQGAVYDQTAPEYRSRLDAEWRRTIRQLPLSWNRRRIMQRKYRRLVRRKKNDNETPEILRRIARHSANLLPKRKWRKAWYDYLIYQRFSPRRVRKSLRACPAPSEAARSAALPLLHPPCEVSAAISERLDQAGSFVFFPNPGNLGDVLIAAAEYRFFQKRGYAFQIHEPDQASFGRTLVYGGGSIWQPQYDYGKILKQLCAPQWRRVIILPSSFSDCDDAVKAFDERFTVFCREQRSFEYLRKLNSQAEILMHDDMALTLDALAPPCNLRRGFTKYHAALDAIGNSRHWHYRDFRIGAFFRTDGESRNAAGLNRAAHRFDLSVVLGCDCRNPEDVRFLALLFRAGVAECDVVLTDRLHIGVAAILLNKELFWLDNTTGKVSGVLAASLSGHPGIHLLQSESEIPGELEKLRPRQSGSGNFDFKLWQDVNFPRFLALFQALAANDTKG